MSGVPVVFRDCDLTEDIPNFSLVIWMALNFLRDILAPALVVAGCKIASRDLDDTMVDRSNKSLILSKGSFLVYH